MKKISILILTLIMSLFIVMNETYAYVSLNDFEENISWEIESINNYDYLVSNRSTIDYTRFGLEIWSDIEESAYDNVDQYTMVSYDSEVSSINVYESLHATTPLISFSFVESDTYPDDCMYSAGTSDYLIDLTTYQNYYIEIELILNPSLSTSEKSTVLSYLNDKDYASITASIYYDYVTYPYAVKDEPETLDDSWWHEVVGNKAYIHLSPTYFNFMTEEEIANAQNDAADGESFNELWLNATYSFTERLWPTGQGIYKPGEDWNKLVIEVQYRNGTEELVFNNYVDHSIAFYSGGPYSETVHSWGINAYTFEEGQISFDKVLFSSYYTSTIRDADVVAIRMYFEQDSDPITVSSVDELPTTIATSSGYESMNEIGLAYITVDGNDAELTIDYQGQTYIMNYYDFDTGYLEDLQMAYYFTNDGNKILQLVYDRRTVNLNQTDEEYIANEAWTPYVHWNLTTDEIIATEKVSVLTYYKKEDVDNIYAYFYMPDTISDKLIHVDMTFDYRYYKRSFPDFWNYVPMATRYFAVSLDYDEVSLTTPQWKKDLYLYTPAAMTIGAMIPGVRWPVLIIGSAILAADYASIELDVLQKEISEIEAYTPSASMLADIEEKFSEMKDETVKVDTINNNLYKLHIGQFDDYAEVEILADSQNITNIVYEVSGTRISLEENFIIDDYYIGEGLDEPEDGIEMNRILMIAIIFIVAFVLINILPNIDKFLMSTFRIISDPKKLVSLLIITILVVVLFLVL